MNMSRKVKLILNPIANLGTAWKSIANLRPIVDELGGADWVETSSPGHGTELARQAGLDGYELVVAMGGDGTVHEIANGLMQLPAEQRPVLGIVPLGSGNDFSFSAGVSEKADLALRQALGGTPHPVDIGIYEDEKGHRMFWTNAVGMGFDSIVTINSRSMPFLHGYPVYFASVLKTIAFNYRPFKIKASLDGRDMEDELIMMVLCNGKREGGGFHVAPTSKTDDGIFNLLNIKRISRLQMVNTLVHFMKGTQFSLPYVTAGQFKKITLQADHPLVIHVDGEIIAGLDSQVRSLSAEILPQALMVNL
jgi:diacylglycerol kinase (ATP)